MDAATMSDLVDMISSSISLYAAEGSPSDAVGLLDGTSTNLQPPETTHDGAKPTHPVATLRMPDCPFQEPHSWEVVEILASNARRYECSSCGYWVEEGRIRIVELLDEEYVEWAPSNTGAGFHF